MFFMRFKDFSPRGSCQVFIHDNSLTQLPVRDTLG